MLNARFSLAACSVLSLALSMPSCGDDDGEPSNEGMKCAERDDCESPNGGAGGAGGAGNCENPTFALSFQGFPLGIGSPTDFRFLPDGSGRFLLSASEGKIYLGKVDGESASVSKNWTIPETVIAEEACGLTNLLLDPEFEENGYLYVTYCTTRRNTRLVRYTWSEEKGLENPALIFQTDLPERTDEWHRFGSLGFEPDGKTLWMLVGDHFDSKHGQTLNDPYGSLIRIVPNRTAGGSGYEIPAGNMAELMGTPSGQGGQGGQANDGLGGDGMGGANAALDIDPTVFAYGFRSPWRGTRDELGRVWVGDVGHQKAEEVNLVTEAGQNFGWDVHEGPCESDCDGLTDPLTHFSRSTNHQYVQEDPEASPATKRAMWLGDIYESPSTDRYCGLMDGVVPFGDLFAGFVRGVRADASGALTFDQHLGHLDKVTVWHVGADGYAYALTLDGTLHRAVLAE